ncbi:aminoglycoside phosphotransferase family protein [Amycolatopsis carbonis]|uniref:Aminoglycoside phosphotransferase family protein n=1 Tax=Amycolatopsis carbonis TaxID=715471 RepID=A0A9Y2IJ30_9PSEU|nr:aminoglycoside phosphotransferase family protein [Amycolatopsis sp. 2-15]WIX80702.1 aminoglycoside phosphotransferase family protein [Amycolatopsis sp. 2-15]
MTEELIRALLRDQHPDLAAFPLRHAATGWDNQLWRLGGDLAVRLPYATERASDLLVKEHRWLPSLASRLPLPVPTPVRLGVPSERFPKHWTVVSWVPGTPADRAPVTCADAAVALGAFLTALHREAPADALTNSDRGLPLATFTPALPTAPLRAIWADALAAPAWSGPPVWLHGDLHPANVVTTDGTLSGVLDFGELCGGDPATDLAAAWVLLPDASRLFTAYATDDATIRRARGWAVLSASRLVSIGEAGPPGGKPTWAVAGRAALARLQA